MSRPNRLGQRALNLLRVAERRDPLILVLILGLAPMFLQAYDLLTLQSLLPYALAATALSLVWGYCGILSLGQAVFYGVGAYAAIRVLNDQQSTNGIVLAVVVAVAVAVVLAWLLALMSFGRNVDAFLIGIITFVATAIGAQLAVQLTDLTGGFDGLALAMPALPTDIVASYYVVFGIFAAVFLSLVVFTASDAGSIVQAVRDNPARLQYFGVNVDGVRRRVFVVGGAVTAVAGVLDAVSTGVATPDKIGFLFSTQILIWCAIGGRSSLVGAAIGALVVNLAANILSEDLQHYWQVVIGLVFLAVVLAVPDGIYSPLRRIGKLLGPRSSITFQLQTVPSMIASGGHASVFQARTLTHDYGALKALDIDELDIGRGKVTALIGPNGAGKSTFVGFISGGLPEARGHASVLGNDIVGVSADRVSKMGLRRKFQAPSVFETLTVEQNLRIGSRTRNKSLSALRRSKRLDLPDHAMRLLVTAGLRERLDTLASALSHGEKQFLEICMVLASDPEIVILDEPTAGLSSVDRSTIGIHLRELAGQGRAILIVEHDFDFIRDVSDRILVMHQGQLLTAGSVAEVSADPVVRDLYVRTAP